MKNGAAISGFLKQIMTALTSKTVALKTKTNSIKTRLIIFSLLRNKKLLISSINHKLQALLGNNNNNNNIHNHNHNNATHHHHDHDQDYEDGHIGINNEPVDLSQLETEGSVIDLVKKSKRGEFRLEDEIDQVADLFIKRFHRQILMQKQLSLKRNQEISLGHISSPA